MLELLYSKSVECGDMNDGGVAFATDSNEVSVLTTFGLDLALERTESETKVQI